MHCELINAAQPLCKLFLGCSRCLTIMSQVSQVSPSFAQFAQFAVSDSTDSMFSRKVAPMVSQSLASEEFLISGVSRLYDELCLQLCEMKTTILLPCAAHMKIRESSTLKFITENFSAKHHNNFSAQCSNFHSARSGKTIPPTLPIFARRAVIFSAQRGPTVVQVV